MGGVTGLAVARMQVAAVLWLTAGVVCRHGPPTSACRAAAQWTTGRLRHLTNLELPLPRHDLSIDAADGDASLQGAAGGLLKVHFARSQTEIAAANQAPAELSPCFQIATMALLAARLTGLLGTLKDL